VRQLPSCSDGEAHAADLAAVADLSGHGVRSNCLLTRRARSPHQLRDAADSSTCMVTLALVHDVEELGDLPETQTDP
jgi:hypothetical protein